MKIELKHKIKRDQYTDYVCDAFDIQSRTESNVTIENKINVSSFDWQIGVIYGGSGSGKTTLLKSLGEIKTPKFNLNKSLISNFDFCSPHEATLLLSAMGLSSVPCWLRPFHTLSNGEQYRASLAFQVGKSDGKFPILIDEYTSVVDRNVAKAMSNALQKYIRSTNKRIVLASCHFDIMEWLKPDWIYSPDKGRVERPGLLRQARPKIKLEIFRCRYESWKIFKQHHYLTEELNAAAKCFICLWEDKPVGFMAILPLPHGHLQNAFRVTRLVILPDYQGLGIGFGILDFFGALYLKDQKVLHIKTSNPALFKGMERNKNWSMTGQNNNVEQTKRTNDALRAAGVSTFKMAKESITKSYRYIGPISDQSTDVLTFNLDAYRNVAQNQISMFADA